VCECAHHTDDVISPCDWKRVKRMKKNFDKKGIGKTREYTRGYFFNGEKVSSSAD